MRVGAGGRWRRRLTDAVRLPEYLGALPAGPNDRNGVFIPRLLLQLTQLSPGLVGSGGDCGGG